MKKRWLTLAITLALVAGLCGCGAQEKSDAPDTTDRDRVTEQATPAPDPTQEPTPEPTEEAKDGYGVGERAEAEGVAVTLTEVEESGGSDFFTPEDGKVFLICHFDIENNSDKDLAISSILSFDAYVDDYATSMSLSATVAASGTQLDGSVVAGKKLAGVIGYEVPQEWSELEVTFKPNVWTGKGLKFVAEKG